MLKLEKTAQQWQQQLSPEQYRIARLGGTEKAFSGAYESCEQEGIYHCVCCGQALFSSVHKYHSGSGWPSYWDAYNEGCMRQVFDTSHGMRRTELRCADCDAHLGHLFEDGPQPSGLRYCINSASLVLEGSGSSESAGDADN